MHYHESSPIEARNCSAWLIELPDGQKLLHIWHPKASIEDVHRHVKMGHPRFNITCLSIGEFVIKDTTNAFLPDGRRIDQDFNFIDLT